VSATADFAAQLDGALRATVIHSPTDYSWFGKPSPRLPARVRRALTPQTARQYLLHSLRWRLYRDFYCCGSATPTREEIRYLPQAGRSSFVDALSASNVGRGYWASGWAIREVDGDELTVVLDDLELEVRPWDCRLPEDGNLAPGTSIRLHFPKESLRLSPGFYMAHGDREFSRDAGGLVRFYWNLRADGAVRLMRQITGLLNQALVPFSFKVLTDPAQFIRCDAGVLYVRKGDYAAVVELLQQIYPRVAGFLRWDTPAFTKPLAPGLGLAEDPGAGESFGLHRCKVLADGVIQAYEQGLRQPEARARMIAERFAEDGIRLDTPYLQPGSADDFAFPPMRRRRPPRTQPVAGEQALMPEGESFLRTAHEIGRQVTQAAIWHGDRCNWLGVQARAAAAHALPYTTYAALGPTLYSGTSGIALFLARLYAATADEEMRRAACGAIRHALRSPRTRALPNPLGVYSGAVGIALAAAQTGAMLGEEEFVAEAAELLRCVPFTDAGAHEFDLLSGIAGAAAALLLLKDLLRQPALLEHAMRFGDELLAAADRSSVGYSWKSSAGAAKGRNLTGFSHGAAGVGYALIELFRATAEPRYRMAAEMAFLYERQWFDAQSGNWPDFRDDPYREERAARPLAFATYWCHGAPGIALSRLRAYEILGDYTCKAEALTALGTTRAMIEKALRAGIADYSLCHGLGGNADVLLHGAEVLGQDWPEGETLARRVGRYGIATYGSRGRPWPCGTLSGETPDLLLGLAGIGYFYLRLHDQTIPSVLLLHEQAGERIRGQPVQAPM
jgi:hypothetical protein